MEIPQIIFFDIDGTLVDMGIGHITPVMTQTLHQLQAKGIRICIATGRSPMTLPPFPGIEFDAFLTFNGSCCYDRSGIIFRNPIPKADVQTVIANATAMGKPVAVATMDALSANGWDQDLADYYAIARLELEGDPDFEQVASGEVYQLMLSCREEDYGRLMRNAPGAKLAAWWERAADIIPSSGGKGVGISKMLEHYGIPRSRAMAFGDGNNDIEMLQSVGTGIAMGNASEALKAVADEVCGCAAEDGIYHYCKEKGLI